VDVKASAMSRHTNDDHGVPWLKTRGGPDPSLVHRTVPLGEEYFSGRSMVNLLVLDVMSEVIK